MKSFEPLTFKLVLELKCRNYYYHRTHLLSTYYHKQGTLYRLEAYGTICAFVNQL